MKTIFTQISLLFISVLFFTTASAQNIAYGKPARTSGIESSAYTADKAVDGFGGSGSANTSNGSCASGNCTRWSSAFSDPQWLYVDLLAIYDISQVRIYWEVANGRNFQIQVSNDAINWTTIKTVSNNSAFYNAYTFTAAAGRYVRFYGTARNTGYGFSIYEFEVFGTPVTAAASPLPIHLLNFSATRTEKSVSVNWTASLDRSSTFTIERSADGINFNTVGTIADANAGPNKAYTFRDNSPLNQKSYYRLKYAEAGSASLYSSIVTVNYDAAAASDISVYPNPATGSTLTVVLPKSVSGMVETTLYNATGTAVATTRTQVNGARQVQFQKSSALPSGSYFVQVKTTDFVKQVKLLVP